MYGQSEGAFMQRYLKPEEEKLLFKTVDSYGDVYSRRDAAWIRLLRYTGIRLKTLCGLTVGDAQDALRCGRLLVRADINKSHHNRAKGVTERHGYEVFVTKKCRRALTDLLAIRREMGFAMIADESLLMSRNHRGITTRSCQLRFAHWVSVANLPVKATPHWLRHTLGKAIVRNSTAKNPLGIVQQALGHLSVSSTGVYTRPDREDVELAMEEAC